MVGTGGFFEGISAGDCGYLDNVSLTGSAGDCDTSSGKLSFQKGLLEQLGVQVQAGTTPVNTSVRITVAYLEAS